jgi:hypothetical protein
MDRRGGCQREGSGVHLELRSIAQTRELAPLDLRSRPIGSQDVLLIDLHSFLYDFVYWGRTAHCLAASMKRAKVDPTPPRNTADRR